MTIASEITRLQNDKAAICTAIENKGVTVGNVTLDSYASCIDAIQQGGGGPTVYKICYSMVGGGGGGTGASGGGGGEVINAAGWVCGTDELASVTVYVGKGGTGISNDCRCNATCRTCAAGTYSYISGTNYYRCARGGVVSDSFSLACNFRGGSSGRGCIGGISCEAQGYCQGGGGGAGACGNGCNGALCTGGAGGTGYSGCGGGGGGGVGTRGAGSQGAGTDGGGNGGQCCTAGCNATCYGGGGGGAGQNGSCKGGNGCQGIVKICYPTDGSFGYKCATGGTKTTSGGYYIHTFTTTGSSTFCIYPKL